MKNTKLSELKELEKLATKIAKKKAKLEQQLAADKEQAKWYDEMLKESGFKSPRALLKAMMEHFGIRTVSLVKAKGNRGPGRPPKAAAKAPATKRKRTKVTPKLRDVQECRLQEVRYQLRGDQEDRRRGLRQALALGLNRFQTPRTRSGWVFYIRASDPKEVLLSVAI